MNPLSRPQLPQREDLPNQSSITIKHASSLEIGEYQQKRLIASLKQEARGDFCNRLLLVSSFRGFFQPNTAR